MSRRRRVADAGPATRASDATGEQVVKERARVSELAHEFGTTPEALLKILWRRGFPVRSTTSRLDAQAVEWLKFEFTIDQPVPLPPVRVVDNLLPNRATIRYDAPRPRTGWQSWRSRRFEATLAFENAWPRETRRRSQREEPALGTSAAEHAGLDLTHVHNGLAGSPYSLPDEQATYLTTNFLPRVAALSLRAQREQSRIATTRTARLKRIARSTEIYESNKIEGLGPDLATTDQVLHDHDLLRATTGVWAAERAIERCLNAEPKIRDVVGLGAARLLAEHFCADPTRPLTGSDIRELHELILVGDRRGGSYKAFTNEIGGSSHIPLLPSDTPAAMSHLVTWLADTQLSPLWRAAVAHAWLTHIHPFHDGNGRVARLLANLVLIRNGMPPLIVSAASDRGAYLDALASSDEGGDILPLARVFRDVLSRGVQDLADPALATQVYKTETQPSPESVQARWSDILTEFLTELAPHLLLHRLNTYLIGDITAADLTRIGRGRLENAWVAKIATDATSRDLLLHVAAATIRPRRSTAATAPSPSIFVSIRNTRPLDARQYLPVGSQGSFAYEFHPLVDTGEVLIRRNAAVNRYPVHEAANKAAEHLARAHRQLIGRPS